MALRTAHGPRPGPVQVEVLPADELPHGVPAPANARVRGDYGPKGQLVPGEGTKRLAALGGAARAQQVRLERLLGRVDLPEDHPLRPYRRDAADWRDAHLARLAQTVGGGEVGPAVQAIVSTAALQHAASRWLMDRGTVELNVDFLQTASKLGNDARQNILAAHELCAREAIARRKQLAQDPQAAMRARLTAGAK